MSSIQQYWPPIRDAIEVNNDPSQPNSTIRAQCPICMEDVAVTSFPPIPQRQATVPRTDPNLGEVLLCGHILCQQCRVSNEAASHPFENRTCPMCRTSLQCIDCGKPSQVIPIPKEGPVTSVPAILSKGSRCRECQATAEVGESIQQGDWPEGLQDLEPGFVPLFYHLAGKLEQQGYAVSPRNLVDAFATIIEDEFLEMVTGRVQAIQGRHAALEGQTPWFADDPDTPVPRPTDLPGGGQRLQRLVPQEDNWPLSGTSPAGPAPQQNPWGPIGEAVPQGLPTPTSPLARPAMQPFDMRSPPSFEGFFGQRSENRPTFSLSEMSAGQAINLTSPTTQWMAFPSSSSPFIEVHTEAAPSTAHAVRAVDPTTPLFSPAAHPSAHEALMREVIEERFGAGLDITASVAELMADRLRRQRPISPLVAWSRGPTLDDREVINRHAVAAMNAHMVAEMSSNSGWDRFGFSHHDNSNDDDYIDFEDLLPSTDDEVTNGDDGNDDRDDSGDYYDLIISADSDTDSEDEDVEMAPAPDFFSYV
ncbi:hypothetical protein FPSE_01732 [Fusarium pseudograminearum CS3096]|uniref:RING-type domain-containing protein n=1 Tax=Fusarium pseudograminearum (strain CS3096) TaxID=1028729 RepID=K3UZK1_FUSPC|nr:hypothetical protein FPSE_01732 [Fusarium pseudograminearum CS3096]EKJ78271.1 hypothetical protein FPSE_01732 [Fusarium pseudograminearum CS3096]